MESFAGADGNAAPTTLAATHAALLRLAAGHGTVKLAISAWDYQDHDPPTSQIDWSASVFAHGSSKIILAHVYAVATPALLLASVAAQLAAHAAAQSADVQALGDLPEAVQSCGICAESPCNCAEEMCAAARDDERSDGEEAS